MTARDFELDPERKLWKPTRRFFFMGLGATVAAAFLPPAGELAYLVHSGAPPITLDSGIMIFSPGAIVSRHYVRPLKDEPLHLYGKMLEIKPEHIAVIRP